jgi:hypothetical protein
MDVMGIYRRGMYMYIRRAVPLLIQQYVHLDFLLSGMGSKLPLEGSSMPYLKMFGVVIVQ